MTHLFDIEHDEREPDRDWDRDLYFEEVLRPRWNRMVRHKTRAGATLQGASERTRRNPGGNGLARPRLTSEAA